MNTVKRRKCFGAQCITQYFVNFSEEEIAQYWEKYTATYMTGKDMANDGPGMAAA
jgi:hypothetical protein